MIQSCETMLETQGESVPARFYEIADRLLSVETDTEWADSCAEAFLRGLHLQSSRSMVERPSLVPKQGSASITLKIMTQPPPPLPNKLQRFYVPGGFCYKDHQSYYLEIMGSRVAVGAKGSKQVNVWLGNSAQAHKMGSLITVMAYAVLAALRRIGLYDLHAAGVVEPESGCCFIFPGKSMTGKTSLTIRLAATGWHYLSDDILVISEGVSGIEARGLRRPFQISDDSLVGCQLLRLDEAFGVMIPSNPEKRQIDPETLFPDRFATSAEPGVLCFPQITRESESHVEETTKADAMTSLIATCPWSNYDTSAAREHLHVLSRLVRQCRTFKLYAGRDIFDEPNDASRLLARLVKEV